MTSSSSANGASASSPTPRRSLFQDEGDTKKHTPGVVVETDGDDTFFEVESIVGRKTVKRRVFYKVKWKGCDEETWEPASNLSDSAYAEAKQYEAANKKRKMKGKTITSNKGKLAGKEDVSKGGKAKEEDGSKEEVVSKEVATDKKTIMDIEEKDSAVAVAKESWTETDELEANEGVAKAAVAEQKEVVVTKQVVQMATTAAVPISDKKAETNEQGASKEGAILMKEQVSVGILVEAKKVVHERDPGQMSVEE